MITRLQSGHLEEGSANETDTTIEKEALLVYPGTFMSMDGEVEITPDHLSRLADTHNSLLARVKRLATGEVPLRECPPIQLDHETKATHTVGRLVGPVEIKETELSDGTKVPALFGKIRVMGKENVEKVKDGRWIHLSIGADLESGKLNEVTITPFPAAQGAAMLSRLASKDAIIKQYQGLSVEEITKEILYREQQAVKAPNEQQRKYAEQIADWLVELRDLKRKGKLSRLQAKEVGRGSDGTIYYFENGIIYDEDGSPVGKAPNEAEAKKFIERERSSGRLSRLQERIPLKRYLAIRDGKPVATIHAENEDKARRQAEKYKAQDLRQLSEEEAEEGDVVMARGDVQNGITEGKTIEYKGYRITAFEMGNQNEWDVDIVKGGKSSPGGFMASSEDRAIQKAKEMIDAGRIKLSEGEEEMNYSDIKARFEAYEKCVKHMAGHMKMSEEDVKEKLGKMTYEEACKMAEEHDKEAAKLAEAEKDEAEKKEMRMAKMKEATTRLSAAQEQVRMAQAQMTIQTRLALLRAAAKISPAEIKKIDVVALAKQGTAAVDAFLKAFESREEPVIDARALGTVKAENLATIQKKIELSKLEAESRARFSSIPKKKSGKRLAEGMEMDEHTMQVQTEPLKEVQQGDEVEMGDLEIIHHMMEQGKHEEALAKMKECMAQRKMMGDSADPTAMMDEKHLSALAETEKMLQTTMEDVNKLIAEMAN